MFCLCVRHYHFLPTSFSATLQGHWEGLWEPWLLVGSGSVVHLPSTFHPPTGIGRRDKGPANRKRSAAAILTEWPQAMSVHCMARLRPLPGESTRAPNPPNERVAYALRNNKQDLTLGNTIKPGYKSEQMEWDTENNEESWTNCWKKKKKAPQWPMASRVSRPCWTSMKNHTAWGLGGAQNRKKSTNQKNNKKQIPCLLNSRKQCRAKGNIMNSGGTWQRLGHTKYRPVEFCKLLGRKK